MIFLNKYGCMFSGGKPFGKFGPDHYSLAHLFDHKKANNRTREELKFDDNYDFSEAFYGLYTCPTNTVYIPTALLKPTDFNLKLRLLLFQKAEDLYKNCCNILPTFVKVPEAENEKWNIHNFQWSECVGTVDHMDKFFDYRKDIMKNLIERDQV